MTAIERQIKVTRNRLLVNGCATRGAQCLAVAGGFGAALVLTQRLFDLSMPLGWILVAVASAAVVGSVVWSVMRWEDASAAAARLDEAAGLRERLSSAHYCRESDDPFARAVVADAERISTSLSARLHIPFIVPRTTALTGLALALCGLMFLIPTGVLTTAAAASKAENALQLQQTQDLVKRKMDQVRELMKTTPPLEELAENVGEVDKEAGGQLHKAADVRHEALKTIDRLADSVKQKRAEGDYESVQELRKMLRGLKNPESDDSPTQKLAAALSQGDFESAKQEVEKLRQQLAKLEAEGDKETAAKMAEKLNNLAKQLDQASKSEQIAQKLEQAGLSKGEQERLLEALKKQDLEQVKKQLAEKGLSQDQVEKLAKQLQQKQGAAAQAQKLAQAMKQAAQSADAGQMSDAAEGMSMAADQLSELEQLEQEMNQLDAALAELQQSQSEIDKPCPT